MNEEFLYGLRTPPPSHFAQRLKARLDAQAAAAAARRKTVRWYTFCGFLIGAAAIALVAPFVRSTLSLREAPLAVPQVASNELPPQTTAEHVERATNRALPVDVVNQAPVAAPGPDIRNARPIPAAPAGQPILAVSYAPSPILDDMISIYEGTYGYQVEPGRSAVCSGWPPTDVVVGLGRMSESERARCQQRGVRFVELTLGFEAFVSVVHRENTWVTSLAIEDFRVLGGRPFEPLTTWNQIRPDWPSLPIQLFGVTPAERTTSEPLSTVRGNRRLPIVIGKEDARIVASVDANYGSLGFMTFATYLRQSEEATAANRVLPVKLVPVVNQIGDAIMPTRVTIQDGSYDTLSRPIVLYVRADALYRPPVRLFATFALESFSQGVSQYGYTAIDKALMDSQARRIRAAP